MNDFTIAMALVDYIPVAFFAAAAIILMGDLYSKMSKGAFALFASGAIMITIAGALKATWKLLYAAKICDFAALNSMFFPTQSIGFLLAGLALILMLFIKKNRGEVRHYSVMGYIIIMVAGLAFIDTALCVLAAKLKKHGVIALFVLSFICSMGMGYFSSRDFNEAIWNWICEGINVVGQGSFLAGAYLLHKNGLAELEL
jgi:hypothetical protein